MITVYLNLMGANIDNCNDITVIIGTMALSATLSSPVLALQYNFQHQLKQDAVN